MSATREHVAWLRYTEHGSIVTCDSDAPKAFKVYRDAAAPEMLAALQRIAIGDWSLGIGDSRHVTEIARAAIAKATGADK